MHVDVHSNAGTPHAVLLAVLHAGPCIYVCLSVYTGVMVKRLVDIDDDLLDRARTACGERTIKATVEAGLQALADRAEGAHHIRLLREMDFDLEAFEESRSPRSA